MHLFSKAKVKSNVMKSKRESKDLKVNRKRLTFAFECFLLTLSEIIVILSNY